MKTFTFRYKMVKKSIALAVVSSLLSSFVPPYVHAFNQSSKPESYKLRKQVLTSNFERTEDAVVRLAQASVPPENLPAMMDRYRDGLKRSGVRRRSARAPRLSGSHFRLSSLTQSISNLTALHTGPLLMHLRKIHENYSLLNIPQSFGYLFRAVLDHRDEYDAKHHPHQVGRYDDKWEFVVHAGNAWSPHLLPKFLTRMMSLYAEQWWVVNQELHEWEVEKGNWDESRLDLIPLETDEEFEFLQEFREVYEDLMDDEYDHLGLDDINVDFYDGPGFVWSEDVSMLAYFIFEHDKLNNLGKTINDTYKDRKDEDYWRTGKFWIDRRYGRILIEYGKKYGAEALRELMITHAERELLGQTHMTGPKDPYNRYDEQKTNFDKVHKDILDWPGQKDLLVFAQRAANDIRLGDFPDYVFVRDMVDTMNAKNGRTPENSLGIFGNYLQYHYLSVKEGRDQRGISAQILNDVFLLIRRDKELYLEYRAMMEELLARRVNQTELESVRQDYLQRLKEKEREAVIQGFAIRNPRFARIFGMDLVRANIDALVQYEKLLDRFTLGIRPPGEWSYEIFDQVFREIKSIVTSENVMAFAKDIFDIIKVDIDRDATIDEVDIPEWEEVSANEVRVPEEMLRDMMRYFGPERTAKKLHSLVQFANRLPGLGQWYLRWRIDLEANYLRWLRPDTYRRLKEEKRKGQYKSWLERTREKYGYEKFYSLAPIAAPFVGVGILLYAPFGNALELHTTLSIWNEIAHSVTELLPYLTVGLVSVAMGASFDGVNQKSLAENTAYSPKNAIEEAVIDIGEKAGDPEEVVREILTPSLHQALSGIVGENLIRVFLSKSDLKDHIENLKRLVDQSEEDRKLEPVITINRQFKEIEKAQVEKELRDCGIDPKKVEIIDQPMTWDGKFSLRALLLEHEEFLEDGYSMWVLNRESWIDLVFQVIDEMRLNSRVDLVELDMKGDLATKLSQ